MMPLWMSALLAVVIFAAFCLWLAVAKPRRWISMSWRQIYLSLWALAGCLLGLVVLSALAEWLPGPVMVLGLMIFTAVACFSGNYFGEMRQMNYNHRGEHFLPFVRPAHHRHSSRSHSRR